MIVLWILLGLAALIIGLLCVPVVLQVEYMQQMTARVRWLFVTILLIPGREKKKSKEEKPEKAEEKPKEEKPKSDQPNILQRFYQYQGIHGFIELLQRTVDALRKFRHGLWMCFCIRKLRLHMIVTDGESANIAEKYGKTCAAIFPPLGWLSSHLRSKRGGVRAEIHPDFTGLAKKQMECIAEVSVCPLLLITALLGLLLRLGFNVGLKFLRGAKPPKQQHQNLKIENKTSRMEQV